MRLLDDVHFIESVIFVPPTISTRVLDRSTMKSVKMEDDAVLLYESTI